MNVDILVIGGGSAGMAAAYAAKNQGLDNILIVERSLGLGGILRQCIHNGFGIHRFHEDLTGVEYAKRYADLIAEHQIPYMTETYIIGFTDSLIATAVNANDGIFEIKAKAIILSMGCRERTRASLLIPGSRSAGIMTAGTAQRFMNIEGYLPGKEVVILGSGDIGLIMARQLVLEGAKVKRVVEIMPYSSGLTRNIVQCLDDFDIPIDYCSTVVEIKGKERVEGVTIAKVDDNRRPIPYTEEHISCDTLLISAGLIPENELTLEAGILLSDSTKGALVDDCFQTTVPGVFSCGNVLHVHDIVDHVSGEGEIAGVSAAYFVQGTLQSAPIEKCIMVKNGQGVTGVTPQRIQPNRNGKPVTLMFRPASFDQGCAIEVENKGKVLFRKKRLVITPGEMERITMPAADIDNINGEISVHIVQTKGDATA